MEGISTKETKTEMAYRALLVAARPTTIFVGGIFFVIYHITFMAGLYQVVIPQLFFVSYAVFTLLPVHAFSGRKFFGSVIIGTILCIFPYGENHHSVNEMCYSSERCRRADGLDPNGT
ncbi:MAG: hypothetical protein LAT83_10580 [Kiritimatiellae bacterium]|nr:hypothetical protein [Kiritimatiellia bacterium]